MNQETTQSENAPEIAAHHPCNSFFLECTPAVHSRSFEGDFQEAKTRSQIRVRVNQSRRSLEDDAGLALRGGTIIRFRVEFVLHQQVIDGETAKQEGLPILLSDRNETMPVATKTAFWCDRAVDIAQDFSLPVQQPMAQRRIQDLREEPLDLTSSASALLVWRLGGCGSAQAFSRSTASTGSCRRTRGPSRLRCDSRTSARAGTCNDRNPGEGVLRPDDLATNFEVRRLQCILEFALPRRGMADVHGGARLDYAAVRPKRGLQELLEFGVRHPIAFDGYEKPAVT